MNLEIVIISDHAGFELKNFIINNLSNLNKDIKLIDLGTNSSESVDYPDYVYKASDYMQKDIKNKLGIFVCATGIGMSIAANRFDFLRAAYCDNCDLIRLSRMHNDINVLCLGAKLISPLYAMQLIEIFLNTKFLGSYHKRRINKLSFPRKNCNNLDSFSEKENLLEERVELF